MPRHLNHLTLLDPPPPLEPAPPRPRGWSPWLIAASFLVGAAVLLSLSLMASCSASHPSKAGRPGAGIPSASVLVPPRDAVPATSSGVRAFKGTDTTPPPRGAQEGGTSLLRDLDVLALRLHRGRVSEAHWRGWLRQPARVRRGTP
jgi:hypothetical protein